VTTTHWTLRRSAAETLLLVLTLGPLAWFFAAGGLDTGSAAAVLRSLGRLTGIVGLAWLLLSMLLSIRMPGFDGPLGGLIRVWHIHHLLGAASFVALLLHPILLALAAAADSPAAVLATLTPPLGWWPLWTGWLALLLMMAFLAPTFAFFGEPDYQRWKAVHLLSAGTALFGLVHAVALARTLSPEHSAWLWALFGVLGGGALLWRKGLSRIFSHRTYRISATRMLARGVIELTLTAEGKPVRYRPGQFVYLTPLDDRLAAGRGEEHPYSLSSAPDEADLRIAIKDLGDASGALLDVTVGSRALVEGPYGEFLPPASNRPALWIGGGIGLTPFVSAVRALGAQPQPVDVDLVYCANDPSRAYFMAELEAIAATVPGLRVHAHYFADEGPLTREWMAGRVADFVARPAYICGPPMLIQLARSLLVDAGVPRSRITSEEFNLL